MLMRRFMKWVLGCGILIFFSGCMQTAEIEREPPEDPFSLISDEVIIEGDYRIRASFIFNRSVDSNSVIPGKTLLVFSGEQSAPLQGEIYWTSDSSFFFLSEADLITLCGNSNQDCSLDLVLIGQNIGNGAICDLSGVYLNSKGAEDAGDDYLAYVAL